MYQRYWRKHDFRHVLLGFLLRNHPERPISTKFTWVQLWYLHLWNKIRDSFRTSTSRVEGVKRGRSEKENMKEKENFMSNSWYRVLEKTCLRSHHLFFLSRGRDNLENRTAPSLCNLSRYVLMSITDMLLCIYMLLTLTYNPFE